MQTQTRDTQSAMTPHAALEYLKQGNQRFQEGLSANRNLLEQARSTAEGQYPFAIVLGCVDSRVPVETVFDTGIGDIFTARVAGNVASPDIIGSMEFATALAGSPLIVVMGHTSCGAVKGSVAGVELGHLTGLLAQIQPAIGRVDRDGLDDASFADRVAAENVEITVQTILGRSPTITGLIAEGRVGLVGAMYDLETGRVDFGELVVGTT